MGKKINSYCHGQKNVAKSPINNKKDAFANVNLLKNEFKQDKYKEILGSKKPIIILNDCLKTMYKIVGTQLKTKIKKNIMQKYHKESKICKKKPKQKLSVNNDLQASKGTINSKKSRSKKFISEEKDLEKIMDTKVLSADSWEIKDDVDLKTKALKDNEKIKVCVEKITLHDKNSNDIGEIEKVKIYNKNYVKERVQHRQIKGKRKKMIHNKPKMKRKQNTCADLDITNGDKSYNSSTDYDNFSHCAVDFSNAIFSTNHIVNKYTTNIETPSIINNQHTKEPSDCSPEREKNVQNLVCDIVDGNVKRRNLPTIIREDILYKNSIVLNVKESGASENNNESMFHNNNIIHNRIIVREFDFSQSVSEKNSQNVIHINECLEIKDKQNSDLKTNSVISKIQVKNIDFDKNTNCENGINALNNENYSTLGNNVKNFSSNIQNENSNSEWNNESLSLLSEDHNPYNIVNAVNNSKGDYLTLKKSLNTFNTNSFSRHVQDPASIDTQKTTEDDRSTNQDINNQSAKRIKLDRNHWCRSVTNACKVNQNVSTSDSMNSITFESKPKATFSQMATSSIDRRSNIVLSNGNAIKKSDEPKSTTDENIRDFIKQNKIQNVKNIDVHDKDSLNIKKSKKVVSNVCDSSMDNHGSVPASVHNSDEESDYISLFADSSIIDEYDTVIESNSCTKTYKMTDVSFDNYYKKNEIEFNQIYENNDVINIPKITTCLSIPVLRERKPPAMVYDCPLIRNAFRGHCYKFISCGECAKYNCTFEHNFVLTMELLYRRDEQRFFKVLEELAVQNFIPFIENFLLQLISDKNNPIVYILKIIKKLYELSCVTNTMITDIINWLKENKPLTVVSNKLETIVNKYDFSFVNWMLGVLQRCTECGSYWDTFKSLLIQTEYLEPQIIEIVLQECINTKRHLQDININVIQKLNTKSYSKINKMLLLTFNNLIKSENNSEVKQNAFTQPVRGVNSSTDKNSETSYFENISDETDTEDSTNIDTNSEDSSYTLHPIDNLPRPYSVLGRKKFWKFYVDVYSLQKGLENNDYDHVINILNSIKENEQSLFTCACYQILCNEIMCSQYHLSKLILQAVRIGSTGVSYQILLNIAICILAHLAENNLWVLAHTLLKDVYVMLKNQINLYQFNAATIMLFAEIYLANKQPIKALTLFKYCNIIFTNRSKWKVQSTRKDDYTRTQIVTVLLDELCTPFPEHAFFLFQILVADQFSNFYPIDLTHCANKIVSVLLSREYNELIIEVGRLIDSYYFTLDTITYRALIATLVHTDMLLAKQLYQNAVALGMYCKPQFHPVTHLIISTDLTKEEMFLAINDLMKQLLSNIGHAIDRIPSRELTVYLIFESIPLEKQVNYNTETDYYYKKKIRRSQLLMKKLLKEKFDPPMLMSKNARSKVIRLVNKSVLSYLQSEHCE